MKQTTLSRKQACFMIRAITLCFFALLALTCTIYAQESAPYIYYYSPYLQGFVIERADGTDSRLMGEGLIGGPNDISGAGWSPSGQWFAWIAGAIYDYEREFVSTRVISTSDSEPLNLFRNPDSIYDLQWSPVEDHLFFIEIEPATIGYRDVETWTFGIVDVDTQEFLVEYPRRIEPRRYPPSAINWASDGQSVSYYVRNEGENDSLVTMRLDGTVSEQPAISLTQYVNRPPVWSSTGWTAFRLPDENVKLITVFNPQTQESFQQEIPRFTETYASSFKWVFWNSTGDLGLLVLYFSPDRVELYLIDTDAQSITLIEDKASSATFDPSLYRGEYHRETYQQFEASWSPDGRYLAYRDLKGMFHIFDTKTGRNTILPVPETEPYFRWLPDSRSAFIINTAVSSDSRYQIVDTQTGETKSLDRETFSSGFSPSIQYQQLDARTILDLTTGESTFFSETSAASPSIRLDYLWNDTSSWVFAGEDNGGTGWPGRGISLMRNDGEYWRELSYCVFQEPCFGFLPSQVDVNQLPTGQPSSVLPAPDFQFDIGTERPFILMWHPDNAAVALWPVNVNDEIGVGVWTTDGEQIDFIPREYDYQEPLPTFKWIWQSGSYQIEEVPNSSENQFTECSQFRELNPPIGEVITSLSDDGNLEVINGTNEVDPTNSSDRPDRAIIVYNYNSTLAAGTSCSRTQPLMIWNSVSGELVKVLNFYPRVFDFSPDDQWLAASGGSTVAFWSVDSLLSSDQYRDTLLPLPRD